MQRSIARAVRGTRLGSSKRMRALATVRWVLATQDGRFVRIDDCARALLTREREQATVYDGRDNEILKARFMQALFGVSLTVVLLDG
jgi:hypothetical protein